jgi:hypothetical protein
MILIITNRFLPIDAIRSPNQLFPIDSIQRYFWIPSMIHSPISSNQFRLIYSLLQPFLSTAGIFHRQLLTGWLLFRNHRSIDCLITNMHVGIQFIHSDPSSLQGDLYHFKSESVTLMLTPVILTPVLHWYWYHLTRSLFSLSYLSNAILLFFVSRVSWAFFPL